MDLIVWVVLDVASSYDCVHFRVGNIIITSNTFVGGSGMTGGRVVSTCTPLACSCAQIDECGVVNGLLKCW